MQSIILYNERRENASVSVVRYVDTVVGDVFEAMHGGQLTVWRRVEAEVKVGAVRADWSGKKYLSGACEERAHTNMQTQTAIRPLVGGCYTLFLVLQVLIIMHSTNNLGELNPSIEFGKDYAYFNLTLNPSTLLNSSIHYQIYNHLRSVARSNATVLRWTEKDRKRMAYIRDFDEKIWPEMTMLCETNVTIA